MSNKDKKSEKEDTAEERSPQVGALLRASRLRVGEDLRDVADILCIRYLYLEAIEECRYDALPGDTYAIGFIRSYAEHLGLAGEEVVRRYRAEQAGKKNASDLSFPTPVQDSGVPKGAIVFVGALLALLVYGGWYMTTSEDSILSDLISPVPDHLKHLATDGDAQTSSPPQPEQPATTATPEAATPVEITTPAPAPLENTTVAEVVEKVEEVTETAAAEVASAVEAATATTEQAVETASETVSETVAEVATTTEQQVSTAVAEAETVVENAAETVTKTVAEVTSETPAVTTDAQTDQVSSVTEAANSATETSDEATTVATETVTAEQLNASALEQATSSAATDVTEQADAVTEQAAVQPAGIVITATSRSWVEIRNTESGDIFYTGLLAPGKAIEVPDEDNLVLDTGNAGALNISVDGDPAPSLGDIGTVRKNVTLNASRLKAGTATNQ